MAAANLAKFKITGTVGGVSLSSDYRYDAVPGEVLTLELEAPSSVLSVTYELAGLGTDDEPLASADAVDLTFPAAAYSALVQPASGSTTITMPLTEVDTHSWILRARASTSSGEQIFERKLVYKVGNKPAKCIPGETTQSGTRGWVDEFSRIIERALPFYNEAGTTADAVATTLGDGFYPPWSTVVSISGRVIAQQNAVAANFKQWAVTGVYSVSALGVITVASALSVLPEIDLSGGVFLPTGPTILISGSGLMPQVAGVAATTIRWRYVFDALIGKYAA